MKFGNHIGVRVGLERFRHFEQSGRFKLVVVIKERQKVTLRQTNDRVSGAGDMAMLFEANNLHPRVL